MIIKELKNITEIKKSYITILELRPHLKNLENFLELVKNQQKEGYVLVGIFETGDVIACMGYRILHTLAWGKTLYIDDLITREKSRGKGYGKKLLEYAEKVAKEEKCFQLHLDTGYHRHEAHKLYLKHGFSLNAHHLSKII